MQVVCYFIPLTRSLSSPDPYASIFQMDKLARCQLGHRVRSPHSTVSFHLLGSVDERKMDAVGSITNRNRGTNMNRILLALLAIALSASPAFAQGNRIHVEGDNNTVTQNQNRSYTYAPNYSRSYENSFNSHSGNTNSYNDSRSNYGNGNTTVAPPVVAYRTPCGKPPAQCRCHEHRPVVVPSREPCVTPLTYVRTEPCWNWDFLCVRCWDRCGKYFIDVEGRRWNLSATRSPVPTDHKLMKLQGRLWTDSDGRLRFTASWTCPRTGEVLATRTFIDP